MKKQVSPVELYDYDPDVNRPGPKVYSFSKRAKQEVSERRSLQTSDLAPLRSSQTGPSSFVAIGQFSGRESPQNSLYRASLLSRRRDEYMIQIAKRSKNYSRSFREYGFMEDFVTFKSDILFN